VWLDNLYVRVHSNEVHSNEVAPTALTAHSAGRLWATDITVQGDGNSASQAIAAAGGQGVYTQGETCLPVEVSSLTSIYPSVLTMIAKDKSRATEHIAARHALSCRAVRSLEWHNSTVFRALLSWEECSRSCLLLRLLPRQMFPSASLWCSPSAGCSLQTSLGRTSQNDIDAFKAQQYILLVETQRGLPMLSSSLWGCPDNKPMHVQDAYSATSAGPAAQCTSAARL
jgi:hypothetical protein